MEECHSDMVSEIQRECILSEAVSIGVRDFTYSIPNSVKSRFVDESIIQSHGRLHLSTITMFGFFSTIRKQDWENNGHVGCCFDNY